MSTFLLVHGGFHGGWCWKRVATRLRSRGHDVYTPTLTGLGERSHLMGSSVDLETHIADVMGVLEWEDLQDVVLVGHSYGGMVITGVADRAFGRIGRLVYLDAIWPEEGECLRDLTGQGDASSLDQTSYSWTGPPGEVARYMGVTDPDDVAWVASKLTPQPTASVTQPLSLRGPVRSLPVLYVCFLRMPLEGVKASRDRAKALAARDPLVRFTTLEAGHDAMVTHPEELTELLTASAH